MEYVNALPRQYISKAELDFSDKKKGGSNYDESE